jgi:hypothetical protein
MSTSRALAFFVALFALPVLAAAQPRKPAPSPTPTPKVVTAQFGYCAAGDTVCEGTNRVRQDANRPFTNGSEGVSIANATSPSGDIVIYLDNSTRSVVYDLRDRVYTGNPQPTWTSTPQNFKVQFVLHDANAVKTMGDCATMAVCEANLVSAMNGGFYIGKVRYRFQWNPGSVLQYINWVVPTSPVNINYKRDATGETWTLTPVQNASFQHLAGMQVEDRNNISFGGQYNMPFNLTVKVR